MEDFQHDLCKWTTNDVPAYLVEEAWDPIIPWGSMQVGRYYSCFNIFHCWSCLEGDIVCICEAWYNFLKKLLLSKGIQASILQEQVLYLGFKEIRTFLMTFNYTIWGLQFQDCRFSDELLVDLMVVDCHFFTLLKLGCSRLIFNFKEMYSYLHNF